MHFLIRIIALVFALQFLAGNAARASNVNFWGQYGTRAQHDINQPVPERSYFTTTVEQAPEGAKLIVEIYHGKLNNPVELGLQVALNDGSGKVQAIFLKELSKPIADNPNNYYSKREFVLNYAELNSELQKILPAKAKHIQIGPGSPLFVVATFPDYSHQWGSIDRGGIFFLPADGQTTENQESNGTARRPTDLDLAYPISNNMQLTYNNPETGAGLSGQIRSRLESEGKFQIPLREMDRIRQQLFEIAKNPAEAAKILGADWTMAAELRYMKKDGNGKLALDQHGLPIPDPMVDTYYDNQNFDAAKNDMVIRYRWTEGNSTGAWNFKPGLTHASKDGIVDRLEFGVDTTDNKPESIQKFADSMDPLNPFQMIRTVVPGSTPSEFLKPAVEISDTRYKFKLTHKNGLVVELSLDYVSAKSLRDERAPAQFGQLEMDIDHLATASQNVASTNSLNVLSSLVNQSTEQDTAFLKTLGKKAFLDGRPVLHSIADLEAKSPVKEKHKSDFQIAAKAIKALRGAVVGNNWIPGAQKNAYATMALGLVSKTEASTSVRATLAKETGAESTESAGEVGGATNCGSAFD